jgi:EmrB/QacA subfamily drug resistance transporter
MLLVAITLGGFLGAFTVSATTIALPMIESEFHVSALTLSWIPLAYVLATAAALMPMGRIADLHGHKRSLIWSLRAFAALLLATAFAPSADWLIGLRAAQGIAGAMVIPASTAIVTFAYPLEARGKALGLFASGPYLGFTLGPVLGGVAIHNTGWRTLFLMVGALGVANCLIPLWSLRDVEWRRPKQARFDALGSALYAVGLPAFLLGFTMLPGPSGTILLVSGGAGIAAFLLWETRAADPLLDLGLFRHNRVFAFSNLAAFVSYAATLSVTFLMSLYLQYTRGLNPQTAGFVLVAGAFVQAVFSPVAGRVADRIEARLVASAGMGLCVLGLLGLVFVGENTAYWHIIAMLCLLGLGFAFFAAPITHAVMSSVESRHVGVASSTLATVRWAGQNLSMGMAGLVLAVVVGAGAIEPTVYPRVLTAVRISLVVLTALCVLGVAASLVGPRRPTPATSRTSRR